LHFFEALLLNTRKLVFLLVEVLLPLHLLVSLPFDLLVLLASLFFIDVDFTGETFFSVSFKLF